jgi:organic radical activating enzyme
MLPLMETFYSIQGEGRRAGYNSLFIRFGGCNFKCAGFGVSYTTPDGEKKFGCDSFYSVDQKFKKEWDIKDNYFDIVIEGNKSIPEKATRYDVVITGGEPLIYWNTAEFQNLLVYYISRGHKVTIETNASLDIEFTKDYQKQIQFSMSVKLENSGEAKHKRINIDSITNILENTEQSYLKFVVAKKNSDITMIEIREILDSLAYFADVYLMPLGDTNEVLNENRVAVAELCIKHNFMYSDRMHIAIWGNKPGV